MIPSAYVKSFVKRNKNDAVDTEAICEAAQRPSMRFVAIKSEAQQAYALVFRTRDLLVRQRTQLINAIRGHLTEYGWVAPKGPSHVAVLGDKTADDDTGRGSDHSHRDCGPCPAGRDVHQRMRLCRLTRLGATSALDRWQAEAGGDLENGRAYPAAPARHRLQCGRPAGEQAAPAGSWLAQMMVRKPRMLVTVTLANKRRPSSGHCS